MQGITVAQERPRLCKESISKIGAAVKIETGSMSLRAVDEKDRLLDIALLKAATRRCGGRRRIEDRRALSECTAGMTDDFTAPMERSEIERDSYTYSSPN